MSILRLRPSPIWFSLQTSSMTKVGSKCVVLILVVVPEVGSDDVGIFVAVFGGLALAPGDGERVFVGVAWGCILVACNLTCPGLGGAEDDSEVKAEIMPSLQGGDIGGSTINKDYRRDRDEGNSPDNSYMMDSNHHDGGLGSSRGMRTAYGGGVGLE